MLGLKILGLSDYFIYHDIIPQIFGLKMDDDLVPWYLEFTWRVLKVLLPRKL